MNILVVTNMFPTAEEPDFGCFVKAQVDSLRKKGLFIDLVFANGRRSKLNYIRGAWQVFWRSLLKRYDLVHAHYGLSGPMARCQLRSPVAVSFCGTDVMDPRQGRISRLISRLVDLSIVKSEPLKRALGREDARVIPNGVDLSLFRPMSPTQARRKLALSESGYYVLFVGNPANGPKRFDLAQEVLRVARERLSRPVELLALFGHPQSDVPLYMNACDVLLVTSQWEGSPNMVKEAMACNTPIVATDVGDIREIIAHTDNNYICPHDPNILADRLLSVLNSGRRADGREKISALSLERTADRIISLYRELLSSEEDPSTHEKTV
jgi:glycosyltransferase involved in cell wall biosynthesis